MLGYVLGIALVLAVLSPLLVVDIFAETFVATLDQQHLDPGDSLTVSGKIVDVGMPIIAMSIYDPDGKIASANNLEISSEKTFSKTIILESPVYEKFGEYDIKLEYGKVSENYNFILGDKFHDSEILVESFEEHVKIMLNTQKKHYSDNETVKINGTVSVLDSPSVLIGVYDPLGMPVGFYFGMVDSNLEFVTDFLVKDGINFRMDGTYSVKAHYSEAEVISFFEYSKVPQIDVEGADVEGADVEGADVEGADVEGADVEGADVEGADVEGADVEGADVEGADVEGADVEGADVEGADVEGADVEGADVEGADVEGADVEGADVEGADVEGADVEGADVKKVSNEIKISDNLPKQDVEIGLLLNQINLKCNSSAYVDMISYYDGMGPALYRLCEFDSALNFFNKSLLDNPEDVEILVNKGSTLSQLGHFSEAIVYYDYAIDIDPNFLPAKNNKANALANMNNLDSAILLYDEILLQEPNYSTVRNNLMLALSSINDVHENPLDSNFQDIFDPNLSVSENMILVDSEKEKSNNFFGDVSIAFSTFGSLFNFLN